MNNTHIAISLKKALALSVLMSLLGISAFFAFEPTIGHTQQITDDFTVSQTITSELSFLVNAANVSMTGSIAGVTGGFATGTTVTSVRTNNSLGYSMKLHFATTTSGRAMQASSTAYINDYSPASAGVPDYQWVDNASGGAAEFGYTVMASSSNELDQSFLDNGSTCNQAAGSQNTDRCWMSPTTTAAAQETIINSTAPNNSSTTTIKFKVAVPSNPSPTLPSAVYVATGTLTIMSN